MLDKDLAGFYQVDTRTLNRSVKRNVNRFPSEFMFQITKTELADLISQNVISSLEHGGLRKMPYAFTEQGVSMLSAVLKSNVAVKISIQIIKSFVKMRKILNQNVLILAEVATLKEKQFKADKKIDSILNAIENKDIQIKPQIFFNGKVFDAHVLLSKLIKKAKKDIVLIDNYIDEGVLSLLTKRKKTCKAIIYTKSFSKILKLDLEKI